MADHLQVYGAGSLLFSTPSGAFGLSAGLGDVTNRLELEGGTDDLQLEGVTDALALES